MKFAEAARVQRSDAEEGTDAETAPIPVPGFTKPDGSPWSLVFRALGAHEETACIVQARAFAKAGGSSKLEEGDPLYDRGFMIAVVATAAMDPDSPKGARTPSFASFDEVHTGFLPLTVQYLYERQEVLQSRVSPYRQKLTFAEIIDHLTKEVMVDDDRFFTGLSPSTRWHLHHITACVLVASPEARSLLSSFAADGSETSSSATKKNGKPARSAASSSTTGSES